MENVLKDKSLIFAVRVVKLAQWLEKNKREYVLSKQVLRSGTAIGALISEADFAQSKADFVSKMSISLKEANETLYWLKLLKETDYVEDSLFNSLCKDVSELIKLLVSSVKTAKEKLMNKKKNNT